MYNFRKDSFVQSAVRYWGSRQSAPVVQFAVDEVVTPPQDLEIKMFGGYLRIPANVCGVVLPPSGQPQLYWPGDYIIDLPVGRYSLQYVDLHRHTTPLPDIHSVSLDAWDVQLKLSIVWRVERPAAMLHVKQPLRALIDACVAAAADFILTVDHDRLVCAPGATPIANAEIARELRTRLRSSASCAGFAVLDVIVLNRQGDRRRTEAIQRAIVEKTVLESERTVQAEKAQLEAQRLDQEKGLAERRREVILQEAQINRLKAEEEDSVRLKKAEISAQEAQLLQQARRLEIELQRWARGQELDHLETLKSLDVRGQAFGQLAGIVLQAQMNPGIQRLLDPEGQKALARAIELLAQGMGTAAAPGTPPPAPQLPTGADGSPTGADGLHERLVAEIGAIYRLPNSWCERLEIVSPDEIQVVAHYQDWRVTIVCGAQYPVQPPLQVTVVHEGDGRSRQVDLSGKYARDLCNIVQEAVWQEANNVTLSAV